MGLAVECEPVFAELVAVKCGSVLKVLSPVTAANVASKSKSVLEAGPAALGGGKAIGMALAMVGWKPLFTTCGTLEIGRTLRMPRVDGLEVTIGLVEAKELVENEISVVGADVALKTLSS